MFEKYLDWRKEKDVDNKIYFRFEELDSLNSVYPHGYHKTCRLGRTVYIERVGMLNLQEIFKISTQERLVEYYIREYQKLILYRYPGASRVAGRKIEQSVTILDCTHGSMKIMSSKVYSFIKLASQVGQDYYPEILGQMFIVNAPFLFSAIWAIVKSFIDQKTRKKINILGGKYQKTLLETIPPQNLPHWLGGTCICQEHGGCLKKEVGPWMNQLGKVLGDAGQITSHNPKLIPRYVGEAPPEIPPRSDQNDEESKQIEKDETNRIQLGQDKVESKEGQAVTKEKNDSDLEQTEQET